MNNINPIVTVLMPVFNCEKYIYEAIDSILQQTFTDFEFLIINDGSKDLIEDIVGKFNDRRILLIHNEKRLGFAASLNKGLDLAKGQYIARMDCDDISHPDRLQKQVNFMEEHPDVGVCSNWAELFGQKQGIIWKYHIDPDEIKVSLLFESVLVHASVIMRKSKLKEYNLYYDPTYLYAEDFEFWQRSSQYFPLANIPEVLYKYRITSTSTTKVYKEKREEIIKMIYRKNLALLNITLKDSDFHIHRAISTYSTSKSQKFVEKANKWLMKLKIANNLQKMYSDPVFSHYLAKRWFQVCFSANSLGFWVWKTFWKSQVSKHNTIPWKKKVIFAIMMTLHQLKITLREVTSSILDNKVKT